MYLTESGPTEGNSPDSCPAEGIRLAVVRRKALRLKAAARAGYSEREYFSETGSGLRHPG